MGALSLGSALYGAVRGVRDSDATDQQRQEFQTNQAIRTNQLNEQVANQPIRRRALEADVTRAEEGLAEDRELRPLRKRQITSAVNIGDMNEEQLRDYTRVTKEARAKSDTLRAAIGSRDPQRFAEAMAQALPGDPQKNPKGELDAQGRLVVSWDGLPKPIVIAPAQVDGQTQDVWDTAAFHALKRGDPVTFAQKQWENNEKLRLEKSKQETIGAERKAVAEVNERARVTAAEVTANKAANDQVSAQVDKLLKGKSELGALIAGYSNTEDSELAGPIKARARELVQGRPGQPRMDVEKAVTTAVAETRQGYDLLSKRAAELTAALPAGVNPTDSSAIEKLADDGNEAAKELQKTLSLAQKHYGYSVRRHMQRNIVVKREKK